MPGLNYAVPVADSCKPTDIHELRKHFRYAERLPRLEVFEELWPDTIQVLMKEGFAVQQRIAVMTSVAETFAPNDCHPVELLAASGTLLDFVRVANATYPSDHPLPDAWAQESRVAIGKGQLRVAVAYVDGVPASCGLLADASGTAELAAVGTLPQFRRHGLASSVASTLLMDFFGNGGQLAWLQAEHDLEITLYERLGFRKVGHHVHLMLAAE